MSSIIHKPYFSIVTPTLNMERYLPRILKSVRNQTFRDFEHIFIDGYSKDKTIEIIKKYKKDSKDIKVTIKRKKPQGVFIAQTQGIKLSKGRYVNLLNADDFFVDENVLKDVSAVTKNNPDINWLQGDTTLGRKKSFRIRNKYLVGDLFPLGVTLMCWVLPQATFMTPELYKKYGYFKNHRRTGMDTDLFLRMIEKETVYFYDREIAHFTIRRDSVSISSGTFKTWSNNWVDFYKSYGTVPFFSGIPRLWTKRSQIKHIKRIEDS